jgi:hypothetical protein
MTAFDILVGVPLLLLHFGGWSLLTVYSLRRFAGLSWAACLWGAFFVGIAFTVFYFRFTALLPSTSGIPLTPEQQAAGQISWLLVIAPYIALLLLLAFRFFRRRTQL